MASNCAVCWWEKNPEEDTQEVNPEYILKEFTVCKKHKESLRKESEKESKKEEMKMAQCQKCGNQDLEYKKGTSKTTGKPWQGWKCEPCNLMHGMNGVPWGEKPKAPVGNPPQKSILWNQTPSNGLEKKIDQILAILKENFPPVKEEVSSEEETPF